MIAAILVFLAAILAIGFAFVHNDAAAIFIFLASIFTFLAGVFTFFSGILAAALAFFAPVFTFFAPVFAFLAPIFAFFWAPVAIVLGFFLKLAAAVPGLGMLLGLLPKAFAFLRGQSRLRASWYEDSSIKGKPLQARAFRQHICIHNQGSQDISISEIQLIFKSRSKGRRYMEATAEKLKTSKEFGCSSHQATILPKFPRTFILFSIFHQGKGQDASQQNLKLAARSTHLLNNDAPDFPEEKDGMPREHARCFGSFLQCKAYCGCGFASAKLRIAYNGGKICVLKLKIPRPFRKPEDYCETKLVFPEDA